MSDIDTETEIEAETKVETATVRMLLNPEQLEAYAEACAQGDPAAWADEQRADLQECGNLLGHDPGVAFARALEFDFPMARLAAFEPETEALDLLPADSARRLRAVPLRIAHGFVLVAMEDPTDSQGLSTLDFLSRLRVLTVIATRHDIRQAIARFYDNAKDTEVARALGLDPSRPGVEASQHEAERLAREQPVVRLINGIIEQAVYRRASDIHFRPTESGLDLLYRIDDELVPVRTFLRALAPALISRLKVLGRMNLAEHRLPQDGRSTFQLDAGQRVDLRFSVLPSVCGESVVVRLLDTSESLKTLDQIGLTELDRLHLDDIMNASHGMFLTTGPTGCGKSTTLYAMLLEMRRQNINILTIEDPVEFHIADIQQMQVNRRAGFTFANAMRNFLRHDPDCIMVGEIRDKETADIAIDSALTGHLLLSTLHTNTAATTVTRMLELGVEAFLLRSSLLAVMAQRLVRLTCTHCKAPEKVSSHVREVMAVAPEEVFYAGRGCPRCNGLGVFRRSAVYELMRVTPALRRLIAPAAEADVIHEQALNDGMTSITQSALTMARAGQISLAEAYRVRAD